MKLYIENKSQYETQSIKDFLKPIIEHEAVLDAPIEVECYHRKSRTLGRAYYGQVYSTKLGKHYAVKLNLPKPNELQERRLKIVETMIHELAHCRGVHHKELMGGGCCVDVFNVEWFPKELTLNVKMAAIKTPRNLKIERGEYAKKKLKEVQQKAKRYANLVKKWQRKVNYYDKSKLSKVD